MSEQKKMRGPRRPGSIDGFVSSGRRLGVVSISNYQPKMGQPTPSLGAALPKTEGFAPKASGQGVGLEASLDESLLLDEPILLEGVAGVPPKKHRFGLKIPRWPKILKRSGLTLLAIFILIGGFLFFKLEKDIAKVFHGSIFSIFHPVSALRGESQGRVNILLAGNSADDPGHGGANLTDSIMLISLDTQNNTGYMLSIPRDLYINYGTNDCSEGNRGKINAVYECGQETNFQQNGFPSGGMGLLEKVIDNNFGVSVDYEALIDYSGLRDAVNAVGGINFNVNSSDYCPYLKAYGLYDGGRDWTTRGVLVSLSNGNHLLNGEQALDLARARGDAPYPSCGYGNSDFTRTQNQRQELLALKSKVVSLGVLSNPLRVSKLLDSFGNSVQTNFQANEVQRLYALTQKIPNNQIKSIGLSDSNVNLVTTANVDGTSYVVPRAGNEDFSAIKSYIARLNSNNPVAKEDASVEVLNASSIDGLATQTAATLSGKGINVQGVGNASATQTQTSIIMFNSAKTATKTYLEKTFGATATTSSASYPAAKNYGVDFVIILGENAKTASQG